MKKIIFILITVSSLSAQTYFREYGNYADSIKNTFNNMRLPTPPEPINPIDLFEMNVKEEAKALKNFSESEIKMLKEIKQSDKMKYYEFLNRKRFRFSFIEFPQGEASTYKKEHERENKIINLEIETEALALQYKSASENKKERIKSELKTKLNALFDLKEEDRKREVEELEKRLKELNASLETRKKNKDEIVNRRIRELTGENKYLRWD